MDSVANQNLTTTERAALRSVRGVVFDFTGVLVDESSWRRWVWQYLCRAGLVELYDCFSQRLTRECLHSVWIGRRAFDEAFSSFLREHGLRWGQIDEILASSPVRRRHLDSAARALPGVIVTLARLQRAQYHLALLCDSETPADQLRDHLRRLRLNDSLSHVLTSIELEQVKPSSACFAAALDALRLPAEQVAFIGAQEADLASAAQAGLVSLAAPGTNASGSLLRLQAIDELLTLFNVSPGGDHSYRKAA